MGFNKSETQATESADRENICQRNNYGPGTWMTKVLRYGSAVDISSIFLTLLVDVERNQERETYFVEVLLLN